MRRVPLPLFPWAVRWTSVLAVVAVIFYYSLLDTVSGPSIAGGAPWWDKQLHISAYATLALATAYATVQWRGNLTRRCFTVLLAVLAYGVVIEVAQIPLKGRYYSLADMLANAVGTLTAVIWFGIERYVQYQQIDFS